MLSSCGLAGPPSVDEDWLVISTIHSGTAAGVFARLLDMGVEPFLVASSVNGVLAQRLVRLNCPDCSAPYEPHDALVRHFGLADETDVHFAHGTGCPQCQEHELVRVRRNRRDRAMGAFGLPVRRYSCRNCTWHGVRLAGYPQQPAANEIDTVEISQLDEVDPGQTDDFIEGSLAIVGMETANYGDWATKKENVESAWFNEVAEAAVPVAVINEDETGEYDLTENETGSEMSAVEISEFVEVEDVEAADEEVVEEPVPEVDEDEITQAVEDFAETDNSDSRTDEEDEEDDFARLCFEVARAKKK